MSLRGRRRRTKQSLDVTTISEGLVDRQHPVAGPAGALRASKFAPGEFVVATMASLAMTLVFLCFSLTFHCFEKLDVSLGVLKLVQQELNRGQLVHRMQDFAQHPHLLQFFRFGEIFFLACPRAVDVD